MPRRGRAALRPRQRVMLCAGRAVGDVLERRGAAVRPVVHGPAVGRALVCLDSDRRAPERDVLAGDAALEEDVRGAVRMPESGLLPEAGTLPEARAPPAAPIPRLRSLTPKGRSRGTEFPPAPPRPASLTRSLRGVSSLRRLSMRSSFELQYTQFTSSKAPAGPAPVHAASCSLALSCKNAAIDAAFLLRRSSENGDRSSRRPVRKSTPIKRARPCALFCSQVERAR